MPNFSCCCADKKLTSFQRQLNLYGFRRFHTIGIAASYFHANFQRGRLDLLGEVKRLTTAAKRELPLPPKIDRRKRTVSKKQLARMKTSKTALSTLSMHKFSLSNDEVSELSSSKSRIEPKPSLWVDRTPWLSNDSSFESLETTEALSDLDIQSLENVSSSNTMLDSVEFTEDIFSELLTMYDCDDQYSHSDSEKPEYMFYHKIVVDGEIFFVPYTGPELDRIVLPPPAELIHFENSHYLCNIASSKLF